jgi:hypothetical protein
MTPTSDVLTGYTKMHTALTNEDPFFSPNLTYTRIPRCIKEKRTSDELIKLSELRRNFYFKTINH